jgi:SAM-dependent methyltransferase
MTDHARRILSPVGLDLAALARLADRPPLFALHEAPFWDDPHIAGQMLAAHLDPATDAASRRPATIDRTVAWLVAHLGLRPGAALLDLGCGPGLYAARFARRGLAVTGVDLSPIAIDHGRRAAAAARLAIDYRCLDYLALADVAAFDAAVLIYWDFGVLPDAARDALLRRVRRALRPGGAFAFDVTTPARPTPPDGATAWAAHSGGFWRPGPHLELTTWHRYPEAAADLRQALIVEPDGRTTVYRVWNRAYTPAMIAPVLLAAGFELESCWTDLAGAPYADDPESHGVVARKR